MKKNKMTVAVEKDADGSYIAYNIDDSDYTLIGRGDCSSKAKADFEKSMQEVAESEKQRTGRVPDMLLQKPTYKFDLASLFEYYSMLNVSAFARFVGINRLDAPVQTGQHLYIRQATHQDRGRHTSSGNRIYQFETRLI